VADADIRKQLNDLLAKAVAEIESAKK
jgi:hypothetical protein